MGTKLRSITIRVEHELWDRMRRLAQMMAEQNKGRESQLAPGCRASGAAARPDSAELDTPLRGGWAGGSEQWSPGKAFRLMWRLVWCPMPRLSL